jgi:hypothetical protein
MLPLTSFTLLDMCADCGTCRGDGSCHKALWLHVMTNASGVYDTVSDVPKSQLKMYIASHLYPADDGIEGDMHVVSASSRNGIWMVCSAAICCVCMNCQARPQDGVVAVFPGTCTILMPVGYSHQ